jgi:uncharacterized membrane protein YbhN (UPF0104 family)
MPRTMTARTKTWLAIGKAVFAIAIVGGVGWQFAQQLREPALWQRPLAPHPAWLLVCGSLYIAGFAFFATFWCALVRGVGGPVPYFLLYRAWYVSQVVKFVPGKALTLVLRAALARPAGVRASVAIMTSVYETLTTMASGALIALVLSGLQQASEAHLWRAGLLLAVAGVPIIPPVFNRLVGVLTRIVQRRGKQTEEGPAPLMPMRARILGGGLAISACGWALFGLSLWALLQALVPMPFEPARWGRLTAGLALAYVLAFVLSTPGGLGTREFILQQLLTPELRPFVDDEAAAIALATVAALLLRLVWTAAEALTAAVLYALPLVAPFPLPTPEAGPPP